MEGGSTSNLTAEGEEGTSGTSQQQASELNEAEEGGAEGQESCSDSQELVESDPEEGPHSKGRQISSEESERSSEESDVDRRPEQKLLEDSTDKDSPDVCVGIHAETSDLTDVRKEINKLFLDIMIGELMIHSFCVSANPQGSPETLVRNLVDRIWADVKDCDFVITPRMMSVMVKDTFKKVVRRWSSHGDTLFSLDLEDPRIEDFIVSSIRESLLNLPEDLDVDDDVEETQKDPEEFSSVRNKVNKLFAEITVGDVVSRIFYKSKVIRTLGAPDDMAKRLFEKVWAAAKDLDVTISPTKMAKAVPAILKDLCAKWGSAEKVLFCLDVEDPDIEDYFVSSFRKQLLKPDKLSPNEPFFKTVGRSLLKLFKG